MADWASESGHWYDSATGEPRYTTVATNGKDRPATLRDARKHGWVPSVTSITALAARYGLERWKAEQLLLACLTLPRQEGEAEAAWIERVWQDSREQARKAALRGKLIHGAVEAHYADKPYDGRLAPWVESIRSLIEQQFGRQEWRPEKSFAHPLGYGGKVDLHSDTVLLDFKGKEADTSKWQVYDEHAMQLAAYSRGLGLASGPRGDLRCGIIFFDRSRLLLDADGNIAGQPQGGDAYSEFHEVKPEALERGWRMFASLLNYWKAVNRVD